MEILVIGLILVICEIFSQAFDVDLGFHQFRYVKMSQGGPDSGLPF